MRFQVGTYAVSVNQADWESLENACRARMRAGEGFALATLNLDHLEKLRHDVAFQRAYAAQDFVTADGNPITWCARLAGTPVSLLPGADLVVPLARIAAQEGVSVALFGSTEAALQAAGEALQAAVPGLSIAARLAPPMGFDPNSEAAEALLGELAGVGLCFLALGAPKQEVLAARGREIAPGVGFVSIGAGLDFLAGNQRRAPRWVRRLAMEWFWRMASNPKRLAKRYFLSFTILPGHLWRSWRS